MIRQLVNQQLSLHIMRDKSDEQTLSWTRLNMKEFNITAKVSKTSLYYRGRSIRFHWQETFSPMLSRSHFYVERQRKRYWNKKT